MDTRSRRILVVSAGHARNIDTIRAHTDDADAGVRASALEALARAESLSDADLLNAFADSATEVRRRAAELLARTFRRTLAPSLASALGDPEPDVVEAAATALGEDPEVDDAALDRLHDVAKSHDDALCRESAIAALGSLADPRSLVHILAAMADKPNVRRRAVVALTPYDDERADAAMTAALDDKDRQVRTLAAELFG
ncbi:MAG: HEAT repeat protein [Candidatus Poriferisodalaceae bacterium]|jgi:HEAT repeat protein